MIDDYSPAESYFMKHREQRRRVRDAWRKDAGDLLLAHESALSVVVSVINRYDRKKLEKQSDSIQGRLSLMAQFVLGVDVCESAISEGIYSQAAALLKQEMETIETVHEFEIGARRNGKSPRLKRLKDFGRIYGRYNEFAHVSVDTIATQIVSVEREGLCSPSMLPKYNREIAFSFFGMHTLFIVYMAGQIHSIISELYSGALTEVELNWLFVCIELLKKYGIVIAKS